MKEKKISIIKRIIRLILKYFDFSFGKKKKRKDIADINIDKEAEELE